MAWRIYKEGQGKWLRGSMAGLIFLGAVALVMNIHGVLGRISKKLLTLPVLDWKLDWRYLVEAPLLILILGWAVTLYNKPKVVDFLIETENELKNRVTWPPRREHINASIVVIITVLIMMIYIFGVDLVFSEIKTFFFHLPKSKS